MFGIDKSKKTYWANTEKKNGMILFLDESSFRIASKGKGPAHDQEVFRIMEFLLETGQVDPLSGNGKIFLDAETSAKIDEETREILGLPDPWSGSFKVDMKSVPSLLNFDLKLSILDEKQLSCNDWSFKGAILKVGGDSYLPDPAQYVVIKSYLDWKGKESKSEVDHLRFIHTLSEAREEGCRVRVNGDPRIDIKLPDECVVDVKELEDGTLELTPLFSGFEDEDTDLSQLREKIRERLDHFAGESEESILRVGRKIVVLNKEQTFQARVIAKQKKIDPNQANKFKEDPAKWMADNLFVHGEVDLLPRVTGIGEWVSGYLGAAGETGEIDWFNKPPEDERTKKKKTKNGGDGPSPVGPPEKRSGPLVNLIERNDFELEWGLPGSAETYSDTSNFGMDFEGYPRTPYPHQEKAVKWLVGHSERAGKHQQWAPDDRAWGAGALFADDMGLGKTFSTILFIGKWYEIMRKVQQKDPPACLVVAPLSLVENWKNEIDESFPDVASTFSRVVLAISGADLPKYRTGMNKDTVIDGKPSYGLKFGGDSKERIDLPGSVVITTYETLHNFRFSLAGCDWGICVFDEAQYIKNPNALRTVAAKSLKGFFRIAITGTPVENHLGDLWSLTDTIEPGYLHSFKKFKSEWIDRMRDAPWESKGVDTIETKIDVGNELKNHLGPLILRRVKEEMKNLDLPKKTIKKTQIPMTKEQITLYEDCLRIVGKDEESDQTTNKSHLSCMWELRRITVHPALKGGADAERAVSEELSRLYLSRSAKLQWLLGLLDSIKEKQEKVIIFVVQRKFQEMLAGHLGCIYDTKVPVINGDTKAVKNESSINTDHNKKRDELTDQLTDILSDILLGEKIPLNVVDSKSGELIIPANRKITKTLLQKLAAAHGSIEIDPSPIRNKIMDIIAGFAPKFVDIDSESERFLDRRRSNKTRLGIIEEFSETKGFAMCVLSPIAAGTGLNIVAANHVIHLERHWNPSKEDQATDRVYRMGQKLPVKVHFSILTDPDESRNLVTFDQGLDQLIDSKRKLMGSLGLIPDAPVKDAGFINVVVNPEISKGGNGVPITIEGIKEISWPHFEALIALIYEKESDRVILNTGTGDSGVDLVAVGCSGKNLLIQCKHTKRDRFDSASAVQYTYGAKPQCEERLGKKINNIILHSNAKAFSKKTKVAAKSCNVELLDKKWLKEKLRKYEIQYSDVLKRDLEREKIGS